MPWGTFRPNPRFTLQQMAFVNEYMLDKNATQAAIRAGYSENSATEQGCQLLTVPHVKSEVKRRMEDQLKRLSLSADTVIVELLNLAKTDMGQAFNKDGSLKPVKKMPENIRRAISSVEVDPETRKVKRIRFTDKNSALTNLAKHFKLISEDIDLTGNLVVQEMRRVTINGQPLELKIGG